MKDPVALLGRLDAYIDRASRWRRRETPELRKRKRQRSMRIQEEILRFEAAVAAGPVVIEEKDRDELVA